MSPLPEANVPLAPFTTWKIGGPAEWFASPPDRNALAASLDWARERNLPVHIIGRGSNILVPDGGLPGLVLCLRSFDKDHFHLSEERDGTGILEVSAGMSLPRMARVAAQQGYGGYEFYIGIPGTVGGAVVMNAGFGPGDERHTANRCLSVETLLPPARPEWEAYADFHPVYRHTDLVDSGRVVLAARFALRERSTKEAIRATTAEHLGMRRARQPLTRPTAGSVFKGTPAGVPAAVYIDRCGLKGTRVGGAVVSEKHANWIENTGEARAVEVIELIRLVQRVVREKEGVELEPEVRLLR